MKLSFLFYDHSNYLKLLWELQIDVSIIYSLIPTGGQDAWDNHYDVSIVLIT